MTTRPRMIGRGTCLLLAGAVVSAGCSDQVVGYFVGPGETTTDLDTGTNSDGGSSLSEGVESSGTGEQAFMPPGCFADDFEDGDLEMSPWNDWAQPGASIVEVDGVLKFSPAATGLTSTGVVGNHLHAFAFRNGTLRARLVATPESNRPVGVFLQALNDTQVEGISVGGGAVQVDITVDDVQVAVQSFPYDPYPAWVGIRGEEQVVHFEVSMDGQAWTTIASLDRPSIIENASALMMTLTYGDDPGGILPAVDDFEACIE